MGPFNGEDNNKPRVKSSFVHLPYIERDSSAEKTFLKKAA